MGAPARCGGCDGPVSVIHQLSAASQPSRAGCSLVKREWPRTTPSLMPPPPGARRRSRYRRDLCRGAGQWRDVWPWWSAATGGGGHRRRRGRGR